MNRTPVHGDGFGHDRERLGASQSGLRDDLLKADAARRGGLVAPPAPVARVPGGQMAVFAFLESVGFTGKPSTTIA